MGLNERSSSVARLKELLSGCGKAGVVLLGIYLKWQVKFLQFLNMKKPAKEPPQKKAKTEEPSSTLCCGKL